MGRFGKSTHISMISNSVTHLQSNTNFALAGNSVPILSETPRERWYCRAERRCCRTELSQWAPISSHRMPGVLVFHDVFCNVLKVFHDLLVVHDVSQCFKSVSWCFTMFSESCNDRHCLRDLDNGIADRLRDLDNSAGIGDNSAEIGDDAAGIVDITPKVIQC